jgi:esterase/lipase superfamily enzyme
VHPINDEQLISWRQISTKGYGSPTQVEWQNKILGDAKAEAQQGSKKKSQLDNISREAQAVGNLPASARAPQTAVLFVTDRNDENAANIRVRFGSRWDGRQPLKCGTIDYFADVNRPVASPGEVRFSLRNGVRAGFDQCLDLVAGTLSGKKVDDVLLFIHGYNNTFVDGVQEAIRLA